MLNAKLRIMKKRNLLKFLFTAVALFAFTAAFAQENAPWSEMTGSSADNATDSVVVNMTVPYYVEPDPILNNMAPAQYDPSQSNADQNINSTFIWTAPADVTIAAPSGDADAPYREVTVNATGTVYTIGVQEDNQCTGPLTEQDILGIPVPTYSIASSASIELCDDGTPQSILVDITAGLNDWSNFYFLMDTQKELIDTEGNQVQPVYNYTDTIIEVGTSEGSDIPLVDNKVFTTGSDGTNKRITEYTYTIKGLNHHISRKGDFLTLKSNAASQLDVSTYDDGTKEYNMDESLYTWFNNDGSIDPDVNTTAQQITVTVYPTPATGEIHYVPNDYEL